VVNASAIAEGCAVRNIRRVLGEMVTHPGTFLWRGCCAGQPEQVVTEDKRAELGHQVEVCVMTALAGCLCVDKQDLSGCNLMKEQVRNGLGFQGEL